jgi:hypothetical protein
VETQALPLVAAAAVRGAPLAALPVEVAMRAGSILTMGVLVAALGAPAAPACDRVVATSRLGRGVCALESVPEGVRARSCVVSADGENGLRAELGIARWTIAAPPVARDAVAGSAGGAFRGATLGVIKQGQAVDFLVSGGASVWLGVSERRGCVLRPRGLVRYDWKRDVAYAFRGTDAGPCGFLVQDLLLRDDTLWVATDLGVSRLRLSPEEWDEWTHYTLSADGAALEETACGSLLTVVAEAAAAPGGEELGVWLAEFRPKFVRRLAARVRRGTPPASPSAREAE